MKARPFPTIAVLSLSLAIAACVPNAEPPAPPPPIVEPAPPTVPHSARPMPSPSVAAPVYENFLDAPVTPGTWVYFEEPAMRPGQTPRSVAVYGPGNAAGARGGEPLFLMVCDVATARIGFSRKGDASRPLVMRITTETTARALPATSSDGTALVSAILDASDPLLDAMAVTKGRFAVALEGEPTLYIPAWVEVSRVIEDCR